MELLSTTAVYCDEGRTTILGYKYIYVFFIISKGVKFSLVRKSERQTEGDKDSL